MTRAERLNLGAVVHPFVAVLGAIVLLWNNVVGWSDLADPRCHVPADGSWRDRRLPPSLHASSLRRRGARPLRARAARLDGRAGPVIDWVADHRKHHAFADDDGDPHSPHGHGPGLRGTLKGLYHAHIGWLTSTQGQPREAPLRRRPARGPADAPHQPLVPVARARRPGAPVRARLRPRPARSRRAHRLCSGAGFVRIFIVHHITWSVNSVCHFFGRRRFADRRHSTNVFWLALPSLGESWHHNHHAFPRSAFHGLRWWEVDLGPADPRAWRRWASRATS